MDSSNWKPTPTDIVIMQQTCWLDEPLRAYELFAPDIVTTMNVDGSAIPMGGTISGRDEFFAQLGRFRDVFAILDYKPRIYSAEHDTVRSRVDMLLRHRKSGEVVMFKKRTVYIIRDNMMVRIDEYVDHAMMETFMRMVSSLEAGA